MPLTIAATTLALTAAGLPGYVAWVQGLEHGEETVAAGTSPTAASGRPVAHDGHEHQHDDPATKNAVSRSAPEPVSGDPVSAVRASLASGAVELQRSEPEPTLVPGDEPAPRAETPQDRYAMAGGCYAVRLGDRWLTRQGSGYRASALTPEAAEPFHFQATDLGNYLLADSKERFVSVGLLGQVTQTRNATSESRWDVEGDGPFTLTQKSGRRGLGAGTDGRLRTQSAASPLTLRLTDDCMTWPEVETNVEGEPHRGASAFQEVRGYLDAHTHGMAFEFLGGSVHCGRPWSPFGVESALVDCLDHQLMGAGAVLENVTRTGSPVGTHDPVGWPTFRDWPAPDSLTHEGTYHKWMERTWRGGQRLFVNLLVENNQLCLLYPIKRNSCDDMDSIRLQAQQMRNFERYVDAQFGGPGKGWYRIVTDPFEAREVINDGKLAVVMGVETSVLFGCSVKLGNPACTTDEIDAQLQEVHDLGVRQMELVNKFDNGLAGVAGDTGGIAPLVNAANFLETGSFWDMRRCEGVEEGVEDRTQIAPPDVVPGQDALFGAIAQLHLPVKLPVYRTGPHCNARGLSDLGGHTIRRMAEKKMLFDPDHMSVKARQASLDVIEELAYPGVLSSHSWSTPDAYPRIYRSGGVITPYAGDSEGFVEKWRQHLDWADSRYYFGFGFGADINGLGAQGNPRGADAKDPVQYPFEGLGGVTIDKNVSGERVYDVNVDGVAHYGLYPDWIEDLRRLGGQDIVEDMERGAEAYLQMWERAEGVGNDACRDDRARRPVADFESLVPGVSVRDVLRAVGQPHSRLGTEFGYCAGDGSTEVEVRFDGAGRLTGVTSDTD